MRGELNGSADLSVLDDSGRVVAEMLGMHGGVMEARAHTSAWMDAWVPSECSVAAVDSSDAVLRPQSVAELHRVVMARVETQPQLWVVTKDHAMTAYVRCLRAEYPSWDVACVNGVTGLSRMPEDAEERDWQYVDGTWTVRRLRHVRVLPE
eukprot:1024806-Rhodomonas_salina.1